MKKLMIAILAAGVMVSTIPAKTLDQQIGAMFMVGFYGTQVTKSSRIIQDICRRGLGGVILFDRHPSAKGKPKNITSPAQLRTLTRALGAHCTHKPLIAVDQEGGKVQRLKAKYGFYGRYPRASHLGKKNMNFAKVSYQKMAKELAGVGINYNLAPVADLALNPKNYVINGLGRSYGTSPERVALFNKIFINAMHARGILTSLKHFPGHGSSLGDTHKGFVDVTKRWTPRELEPFELLIKSGKIDSIMIAHVFNGRLDSCYPASLSRKTITGFLRKKMGYRGVVISDDLQMHAISKHYSLRNTIKLAINAGTDILLFGNQIDPTREVSLKKLIAITKDLLAKGEIKRSSIVQANRRIDAMRARAGL